MRIRTLLRVHLAPSLAVVLGVILTSQRLVVYPSSAFDWHGYDDRGKGGNSEIRVSERAGLGISCSYSIGDNLESPFTGISFAPRRRTSLIGWSTLNLRLESEDVAAVRIFLKARPEDTITETDSLSHVHYLGYAPILPRERERRIPLRDFCVPGWWYSLFGRAAIEDPERLLKERFSMLDLQNMPTPSPAAGSFVIRDVYFSRDRGLIALVTLLFLAAWYASLGASRFLSSKAHTKVVFLPDGSPASHHANVEDAPPVVAYINEHYHERGISISSVCSSCHCSADCLSAILKECYGLNFRQYLGVIRVNEAKRLIATTGMNVSEVAEMLGFSDRSSFSRTFAEISGMSPREYRQSLGLRSLPASRSGPR